MYIRELEELLQKPNLRSADKANMLTILKNLKRGGELSYQEKVNVWAYCNRYGVPVKNYGRP